MLPGDERHGGRLGLGELGLVYVVGLVHTCDSQKRWWVEAVLRLAGGTGITRARDC
jgi:hypothetical protein